MAIKLNKDKVKFISKCLLEFTILQRENFRNKYELGLMIMVSSHLLEL